MLKQPLESSMTILYIKSGFRRCEIHPFNPNAIDKTQLFRNKLIPNRKVDLFLPPTDAVPAKDTCDNQNSVEDIILPDVNQSQEEISGALLSIEPPFILIELATMTSSNQLHRSN